MTKLLKIIGAWAAVIATALSLSYCSELPKYRFEKAAIEAAKALPGSRLISTTKSGDLLSPVSWLWPAKWHFAMPDRQMGGRFYTVTLVYGEKEAIVFLVDVDCDDHTITWYDLDEPDTAYPARDLFGEPVIAPSGQTYRRIQHQLPTPPGWMHEFCDTDWTAERKAAANQ